MFNVYTIENQNFYLNDYLVSGIKSFNVGVDLKIAPQISINDSINYTKNGLPVTQFGLSLELVRSAKISGNLSFIEVKKVLFLRKVLKNIGELSSSWNVIFIIL